MRESDPYTVQSPWGGIAGLFMCQCFGFVTLQGFRMFLHIALYGSDPLSAFDADSIIDRILLPAWGGAWLFLFVAFQTDIFRRISGFTKDVGIAGILGSLSAPTERLKCIVAILFALVFISFQWGKYPFPSKPIPTAVSCGFSLFSWIVPSLIAWGIRKKHDRQNPHENDCATGVIIGYIISSGFIVVALFVTPGLFYFHGMLGLGVFTMLTCQILFKTTPTPRAE